MWWRFDAPRQPVETFLDCPWDGEIEEPRKRLGGTGTAENDLGDGGMGNAPRYWLGLPTAWVNAWDAGRMVDVHGIQIGTEYVGMTYGEGVDPDDPPIFESQAAYLGWFGLLFPGELERLPKVPSNRSALSCRRKGIDRHANGFDHDDAVRGRDSRPARFPSRLSNETWRASCAVVARPVIPSHLLTASRFERHLETSRGE